HVFDDPVAVVHDGGADLYAAGAEEEELGRVPPAGDAADAADRDGEFGIACKLRDHVERDGLYRGAAIATVGGHSVDIGVRDHRVEVDAHYGVDRVDQRYGVGAALHGGFGGRTNVGHVGGKLDDDRELRDLLDPLGD